MDGCFRVWFVCSFVALLCFGSLAEPSQAAALTAAQRKELAAIRAAITKVHIPVHRDAIDDAEKKTADAEQRFDAFVKESGLAADDSHLTSLKKLITGRREAIAKARERYQGGKKTDRTAKKSEQGASFVGQVVPIIKSHCLDCHGKGAKGGLRLDTFAGWEKGGKSGPLLVIGDAQNSLLMDRLVVPGPTRMPKGSEPLA